jgi:hypothetical protein
MTQTFKASPAGCHSTMPIGVNRGCEVGSRIFAKPWIADPRGDEPTSRLPSKRDAFLLQLLRVILRASNPRHPTILRGLPHTQLTILGGREFRPPVTPIARSSQSACTGQVAYLRNENVVWRGSAKS